MNSQQKTSIVDALMVAYEVMGREMSEAGAQMILRALDGFEFEAVMTAIKRTVSEAKFITPAEIISRVDDGRPDPEKAWSEVCHYDPDDTYTECMTEEQSLARGACWHLLASGDKVAARMAFKEEYVKLCAENRLKKQPVKYVFQMGRNKDNRLEVVKQAILDGKITQKTALAKLPEKREEILNLPALPSAKEAMGGLISGLSDQVRMK